MPKWKSGEEAPTHPQCSQGFAFWGYSTLKFWGECDLAETYLINYTPSSVFGGCTPFEVLFGRAPKYSHIKVFVYLGYAKRQGAGKDKFGELAEKCIFVGYSYGEK